MKPHAQAEYALAPRSNGDASLGDISGSLNMPCVLSGMRAQPPPLQQQQPQLPPPQHMLLRGSETTEMQQSTQQQQQKQQQRAKPRRSFSFPTLAEPADPARLPLHAPPSAAAPTAAAVFPPINSAASSSSAGLIKIRSEALEHRSYSASSASAPLSSFTGAAVGGAVLSEVIGEEMGRLRQVRLRKAADSIMYSLSEFWYLYRPGAIRHIASLCRTAVDVILHAAGCALRAGC
jgi:hypothetical protein